MISSIDETDEASDNHEEKNIEAKMEDFYTKVKPVFVNKVGVSIIPDEEEGKDQIDLENPSLRFSLGSMCLQAIGIPENLEEFNNNINKLFWRVICGVISNKIDDKLGCSKDNHDINIEFEKLESTQVMYDSLKSDIVWVSLFGS